MGFPGLRIITKYWKRYAMVFLIGACFVVTVMVAQQWLENNGEDEIIIDQRALADADGLNGEQPRADPDSGQQPPAVQGDNNPAIAAAVKDLPSGLSLREMEMRNAKLEAELKYEKLKAEMLNRDLVAAKKTFNDSMAAMRPQKPLEPHKPMEPQKPIESPVVVASYDDTLKNLGLNEKSKSGGGGVEVNEDDLKLKLQERRTDTIKRICKENPKETGLVKTVMTTRHGVTYCHIPGVMELFWLRVLRFVNRDYVIDPVSPYDITQKDALERPFIRLKQLKWSRLSEDDKTPLLRSKIFMAVENPYMRLWDLYIHTVVLPIGWSTVGQQIESKRKTNELLVKTGVRKKFCGKDVTFDEFVHYTLETSSAAYEPYHRICDPCQLNPTYIVKTETAKDDIQKVLYHFNLDYLTKIPNYSNNTIVRYLTDLVSDVWPRYMRSKAEHCVTPGDIGKSLWRALKMEGLINEATLSPLLGDTKTAEIVLQDVINLYIGANLNVEAQKARMMVQGYKMLSASTKDAIKKKYKMDFQLFEYSDNVDDAAKGL